MKHDCKFKLADGHIILQDGHKQLLIDTGAPSSFGDTSPLAFAGNSYPMQSTYMGISLPSLSESIGTPINALIGADILNQYDIFIDPVVHTFSVTEGELPLSEATLVLDSFMGLPIIEARVGQDTVRMFFDTGAKLSYLAPDRTGVYEAVGTERDFYPGFGDFTTNVYDIPIKLASESLVLRVGNLPMLLHMTLMMASTSGILGTAILRTHKVVFAPRRQKLALQRIDG